MSESKRKEFERSPRDYAYGLFEDEEVSADTMILACLKWLSQDQCREMLQANELTPELFFQED